MPPSLAAASASRVTRAWLWAVTIRSVSGAISEADDALRIGLHHDLDSGGPRGGGQPVLAVVDDDAGDIDPVLAQRVECRHAEMAGTDQGDPHVFRPSLIRPICR